MSNNLGRVEITANQNNKEVTANTSDGVLDAAITETLVIDVSAGSRLIDDDTDIEYADFFEAVHLSIEGATTSGRTITIDPVKCFKIVNLASDATNSVDIIVGSSSVTIEIGELVLIRMDGTTNGLSALTPGSGGGGGSISPRSRRIEGSSTTLVIGDDGDIVTYSSASAGNITVPPNSSVAFAVGSVIDVSQGGAGQATIVAGAGVTIGTPSGCTLKLRGQRSYATLVKTATDAWELFGDLELSNPIGAASDTAAGIVELATPAEVLTGTDTSRAVTAAGVKGVADLKANITSVRERLTGARTYYVRTDGSNSNTGLANTSGGAFATIQKALDVVAQIDTAGYAVTIQLGDTGTFAGATMQGPTNGSGAVTLSGSAASPSSYIVSSAIICRNSAVLSVSGLKYTSSANCLWALLGGVITISGTCEFAGTSRHMNVEMGGVIIINADYSISASAANHWASASSGAIINTATRTITLTGTPAFSSSFAIAVTVSTISVSNVTFSGSATGSRYFAHSNSVISSGGTTFPGSTAGSTGVGGQYV